MSPLFWQLAKNCGLYDDLLTTFTNHKLCAKILVVAIYFIVIGDNSARHISNFTETHFLPENIKLTGQLLSEFYKGLSQENQFFANRFLLNVQNVLLKIIPCFALIVPLSLHLRHIIL